MRDYFDYVNEDTNDESNYCGIVFDELDIEKEAEEMCTECCYYYAYPDCKDVCNYL